jgi:hypothetical protein
MIIFSFFDPFCKSPIEGRTVLTGFGERTFVFSTLTNEMEEIKRQEEKIPVVEDQRKQ